MIFLPIFKKFYLGQGKLKKKKNYEISFENDVYYLFQKAAENSLIRFKTPIITPEILFLTLMEEKNIPAYQLLKEAINNSGSWYFLRYELIKRIHFQESMLRNQVSINQHYFAYLLRLRISDKEFQHLIENKILSSSVSIFRNTLVSRVLRQNIFTFLNRDIKESIKNINLREYSS